ncbi:hypothetical protein F5B20DRAFT_583799 [Whalleya microplaca]|nr:hypothetical protein F5B20DRAFT_583799 [Whalleya microplaca]
MTRPVRESVQQINESSTAVTAPDTPSPLRLTWCLWQGRRLPKVRYTVVSLQVHEAGAASAVWSFGDAFPQGQMIRPIPASPFLKALYHDREANRSYLFVSRVPGRTLEKAWRGMGEEENQHYGRRIVGICKELLAYKSDPITGVDGAYFHRQWLNMRCGPHDLSSESLRRNCEGLGMECTSFVFCHGDLALGNIIVDAGAKGVDGIIDWEAVGYVPLE